MILKETVIRQRYLFQIAQYLHEQPSSIASLKMRYVYVHEPVIVCFRLLYVNG